MYKHAYYACIFVTKYRKCEHFWFNIVKSDYRLLKFFGKNFEKFCQITKNHQKLRKYSWVYWIFFRGNFKAFNTTWPALEQWFFTIWILILVNYREEEMILLRSQSLTFLGGFLSTETLNPCSINYPTMPSAMPPTMSLNTRLSKDIPCSLHSVIDSASSWQEMNSGQIFITKAERIRTDFHSI